MKKLLKVAAAATLLVSFAPSISAEGLNNSKVEAAAAEQELSVVQKLEILRETAVKYGIPAEILKAMALKENKTLNQYDADGKPLITNDNGIGLMQLTFTDAEFAQYGVSKEKLMYDTRYNIEQGAIHLLRKWDTNYLPVVNKQDKNNIEDWYFAVMAYNGLSKRNDPNLYGSKAYQEVVFQYIRDYSQLPIGKTPALDIRYDDAKPGIMFFPEGKHYDWPTSTKTTQNYKAGDIAYTFTDGIPANLRKGVDGPVIKTLPNYTPLKIISEPKQTSNKYNHFVAYDVEVNGFSGTVASSNLIASKTVALFTDVSGQLQQDIVYLQARDIIDGYTATKFEPNYKLTRGQATKLIVEALNLPASDYKLTATDVPPSHPFYEYMRIAEANGIMKGIGGEFHPGRSITRSDMASILVRAFEKYLDTPPANYKYTGIPTTDPNYANINKLAFNGITNAIDYKRDSTLSRGEFARFLKRAVEKKESKE